MALVIGDNFYTTTALHTKREKAKVVRGGEYLQLRDKVTHATQE